MGTFCMISMAGIPSPYNNPSIAVIGTPRSPRPGATIITPFWIVPMDQLGTTPAKSVQIWKNWKNMIKPSDKKNVLKIKEKMEIFLLFWKKKHAEKFQNIRFYKITKMFEKVRQIQKLMRISGSFSKFSDLIKTRIFWNFSDFFFNFLDWSPLFKQFGFQPLEGYFLTKNFFPDNSW